MNQTLDFQSIIFKLQQFWGEHGCLIWQPYYSQVGAGTMNPATVLRVLGPEPWNVAYVEPSVRPDDGRYGENPNRLQQHTQFQVILKPDPGNPQELYLKSLEAIGIDPHQHDIRFVEDNWESPALGAWGLGWEVWCDGQEITQFTYFQQAGGQVLEPNSVEITYGLERIAMSLQKVRSFRDIRWNNERTYGDVHLAGEQEHSKYYFEVADVERLRQMYTLFEAEAEAAIAQGLVLPSHDYLLKCSHTFNVLDTRGAVGVTERQALFSRMRDLSRRIAEVYIAQRQRQEYPWLKEEGSSAASSTAEKAELPVLTGAAPFLFEIGTEELPAADLDTALAQLGERIPALLDELRLEHGDIRVVGTPRRLTAIVENLSPRQPDREVIVKGPPANRSFDSLGQPTKAAEGFARSKGLNVSDLQVREMDGGQYAAAVIQETGKPAAAVLAEALPGLIASIKFDKAMRWNASGIAFSRPIRWLLAIYGGGVIPFSYAGLQSGASTRGLRFHEPESKVVHTPQEYEEFLRSQGILLDVAERKAAIVEQVRMRISAAGGDPDHLDAGLLEEVVQLVEAPTAFLGTFDPSHLRLPPEVLISVMKKHQRYFPVFDAANHLLPCFVGVRNGDDHGLDIVADGNEQVIRARFADANFFINEDLHTRLEDLLPALGSLTFQKKLGSMLDKTKRIEMLVEQLMPILHTDPAETDTIRRAAQLCKADLVSHMVVEMTALQGIMGRYYAAKDGEAAAVGQAIFEHYLPRNAGDEQAKSAAGLVVGLADRLDSLTGLFAAGLAPTGTKDPFAQRRTALGLVQTLVHWELDFDLHQAIELAAAGLPIPSSAESQSACLDFITGRLQAWLLDQGYRYDVVAAVLAAQGHNPFTAVRAIRELSEWLKSPDWSTILPAYSRCVRITRDQKETFTIDPDASLETADKELLGALLRAESIQHAAGSADGFFKAFLPVIPVINRFFESVMVMAEDPALRAARLGMLQRIAALAKDCADFSRLEGF